MFALFESTNKICGNNTNAFRIVSLRIITKKLSIVFSKFHHISFDFLSEHYSNISVRLNKRSIFTNRMFTFVFSERECFKPFSPISTNFQITDNKENTNAF
jgi:hypothetical protein